MIRYLKRYLAIRSYMHQLSRDLVRRFEKRSYYSVQHVTQAVQRGGLTAAFIAYAHAAFCTQEDFDAHYKPMGVACSYQGLRRPIARRYFSGRSDFDASTIINRFQCGSYHGAGGADTGSDSDAFYGGHDGL